MNEELEFDPDCYYGDADAVCESMLQPDYLVRVFEALTIHLNYDGDYLEGINSAVSEHCRNLAEITEVLGKNLRKQYPKEGYREGRESNELMGECSECGLCSYLIPVGHNCSWGICEKHETRWEIGWEPSGWMFWSQAELKLNWLLYSVFRKTKGSYERKENSADEPDLDKE